MKKDWTTKIYTKEGLVKKNILDGHTALDIGCGQHKLPGSVGVDFVKNSKADVIHDLSKTPWPFSSDSFDLIFANHALEHIEDIAAVLGEIHRIAKRGGVAVIQVPYFRSVDAFADLTHRHFFTSESFEHFTEGTKTSDYRYTNFVFRKVGFWYGWPQISNNPFARIFKRFIHRFPRFYDQYLSLLFPVKCLTWELEVIK